MINKAFGVALLGLGFGLGMFVGKNQRLVRKTGRRLEALKDDAKGLADSAGEWVEKGKKEINRTREGLACAAEGAVSAYERLTA